MNALGGVGARLFGLQAVPQTMVHSPDDLHVQTSAAREAGLIEEDEQEMIDSIIELDKTTAREVMVPRPDIFSLPGDMSLDDAVQRVVEEQHSRVPIYDPGRGPEFIIGVLYAKDLMRWMRYKLARNASDEAIRRQSNLKVRHIMRDVLVVPEPKPLTDLLVEFKNRKRHLAVVVDEFGSTAGVITVEDVLEQLVGEIEDEFDVPPEQAQPGGATMVLEASTPIRDLEHQYKLPIPRDEGFETLAGFVLTQLQKIPKPGDCFEYEGRKFTVLEMDGHRIETVKVEQAAVAAS